MFNLENFVDDCLSAVRQNPMHRGVAEVVARAMRDPSGITAALGERPYDIDKVKAMFGD